MEEAETRCGGPANLERAVSAGRVYKEIGEDGNNDAYFFNRKTRGEGHSYSREEKMKGARTVLGGEAVKKLSDFFEGTTFIALEALCTHKLQSIVLSHAIVYVYSTHFDTKLDSKPQTLMFKGN